MDASAQMPSALLTVGGIGRDLPGRRDHLGDLAAGQGVERAGAAEVPRAVGHGAEERRCGDVPVGVVAPPGRARGGVLQGASATGPAGADQELVAVQGEGEGRCAVGSVGRPRPEDRVDGGGGTGRQPGEQRRVAGTADGTEVAADVDARAVGRREQGPDDVADSQGRAPRPVDGAVGGDACQVRGGRRAARVREEVEGSADVDVGAEDGDRLHRDVGRRGPRLQGAGAERHGREGHPELAVDVPEVTPEVDGVPVDGHGVDGAVDRHRPVVEGARRRSELRHRRHHALVAGGPEQGVEGPRRRS